MHAVHRILDANANRAREALRVMEEAARFLLDDPDLCGALKRLRHELAAALAPVPGLLAHRDTPGDVGTSVHTPTEGRRDSVLDVATAAGRRAGEALRAIEEYAKILDVSTMADGLPGRVEQLRYRVYELERRLVGALGTGARRQWRLCVLITASLCRHHDWADVLDAALKAGADCIQYREKDLGDGELLRRARHVVARCRHHGAAAVLNDRPDIALLCGADGIHVGQADVPCGEVRKLVGRQLLVGVSTSALDMARRALADGADYCGVGPMYATTTKHKPVLAGPEYLRRYIAWDRLPHLAIGGITPQNVGDLVAAGARGIAVSSAVCAAPDPAAVVRELACQLMSSRAPT